MFWDAVQCNCYLTWSSLPFLRNRTSTLALYWTLFFAISFHHLQCSVFPMLSSSFVRLSVFLHDSFGLLVFLFSGGFHVIAILVMLWLPFFKAWPIHFHFLLCSLQSVWPHPVSSQCCPALLSLHVSMIALVFLFSFSPGDFTSWPFWWCHGFPFSRHGQTISTSFIFSCLLHVFLFAQFLPVVPCSWWHSAKRCQVSGRIFLLKYVTVVY